MFEFRCRVPVGRKLLFHFVFFDCLYTEYDTFVLCVDLKKNDCFSALLYTLLFCTIPIHLILYNAVSSFMGIYRYIGVIIMHVEGRIGEMGEGTVGGRGRWREMGIGKLRGGERG